ncbi:pentapeptide repeat-containing protein [Streptomyces maoxianensis]|uniref:Pentapeptide repeat-containing protein n=1 Tax=Streptomyces maoxianensis TaxID=1459942 RepID=A0ABV9GIK4_9ACTN
MTTTGAPAPSSSRPYWPHCGHGADTAGNPVGCRGRQVEPHDACLAHLTDTDRTTYLNGLAPGSDLDHRGTHFADYLLEQVLNRLHDPTTGRPHLGTARFDGATFSANASFSKATFSANAWFDGATFSAEAWFDEAAFSAEASFAGATFSAYASFSKATFSAYASFDRATFSTTASFTMATFSADARFQEAAFAAGAEFELATFSAAVSFDRATFSGSARFLRAAFEAASHLEPVSLTGHCFVAGLVSLLR